jgi:hypothetical protein
MDEWHVTPLARTRQTRRGFGVDAERKIRLSFCFIDRSVSGAVDDQTGPFDRVLHLLVGGDVALGTGETPDNTPLGFRKFGQAAADLTVSSQNYEGAGHSSSRSFARNTILKEVPAISIPT